MSSLGGQWRVIRHYLSMSNLNAEVEKLVQKIRPASPEQWESKYLNRSHSKFNKIFTLIVHILLHCVQY